MTRVGRLINDYTVIIRLKTVLLRRFRRQKGPESIIENDKKSMAISGMVGPRISGFTLTIYLLLTSICAYRGATLLKLCPRRLSRSALP